MTVIRIREGIYTFEHTYVFSIGDVFGGTHGETHGIAL
jgi:hypothetical protein